MKSFVNGNEESSGSGEFSDDKLKKKKKKLPQFSPFAHISLLNIFDFCSWTVSNFYNKHRKFMTSRWGNEK